MSLLILLNIYFLIFEINFVNSQFTINQKQIEKQVEELFNSFLNAANKNLMLTHQNLTQSIDKCDIKIYNSKEDILYRNHIPSNESNKYLFERGKVDSNTESENIYIEFPIINGKHINVNFRLERTDGDNICSPQFRVENENIILPINNNFKEYKTIKIDYHCNKNNNINNNFNNNNNINYQIIKYMLIIEPEDCGSKVFQWYKDVKIVGPVNTKPLIYLKMEKKKGIKALIYEKGEPITQYNTNFCQNNKYKIKESSLNFYLTNRMDSNNNDNNNNLNNLILNSIELYPYNDKYINTDIIAINGVKNIFLPVGFEVKFTVNFQCKTDEIINDPYIKGNYVRDYILEFNFAGYDKLDVFIHKVCIIKRLSFLDKLIKLIEKFAFIIIIFLIIFFFIVFYYLKDEEFNLKDYSSKIINRLQEVLKNIKEKLSILYNKYFNKNKENQNSCNKDNITFTNKNNLSNNIKNLNFEDDDEVISIKYSIDSTEKPCTDYGGL